MSAASTPTLESVDTSTAAKSFGFVSVSRVDGLEGDEVVVDSERNEENAEEELQSLEYEEDCFYELPGSNSTPSFDQVDEEEEISYSYWTDERDFQWSDGEACDSDGSVPSPTPTASVPQILIFRSGGIVRKVRLGLQDFVQRKKKYRLILQRIRKKMTAKKGEEPSSIISDDVEFQTLTEEEKEQQREIWEKELAKVEEEIETLKSVLKSKMRLSQQLKKKLGFTMWREISGEFSQGVKTVKESTVYQSVGEGLSNLSKAVVESPAYHNVEDKLSQVGKTVSENPVYQKTESVVKMTAESTRSIIGGLTGGITQKLGQIKSSDSFRSLEDKVGSAYENVKTKVSSRSSSIQSFDEALREDLVVTSPTIPEEKPLS